MTPTVGMPNNNIIPKLRSVLRMPASPYQFIVLRFSSSEEIT